MESKEIFEETGRIGNEIGKYRRKIETLNKEYLELTELCPHEIVFKYMDNHPRKMMIDGTYFCPACGKIITCTNKDQINESPFKDSRVIPLINLSLLGTPGVHYMIRNEVYDNFDVYYDPNVSTLDLANKMEDVLKDYQYEYQSNDKVFQKTKKLKD